MSDKVRVEFELLDVMPEIRLIQLLMDASKQFDNELSDEEKNRAVNYFVNWYSQTKGN